MTQSNQLDVDQDRLVQAWKRSLPTTLNKTDSVEVLADGQNPKALWVHIKTAGHTKYSFDFKVTYVDDRETKVEFIDVEKDNRSVDEHTDTIQTLIEDYVRHIHECAQVLQEITHH